MADKNLWGGLENPATGTGPTNVSNQANPAKNGFQPNQALPEQTVLVDNSTNAWINNANLAELTTDEYFSGVFLNMLENNSNQIMLRYATQITIPDSARNALSYRVSRFRDFGVNLEPLREAQLPPKFNMSAEGVNVTTSRYGGWIEYTADFDRFDKFNILNKYTPRLIESALKSMDIITREVVYMQAGKAIVGGTTIADLGDSTKKPLGLAHEDLQLLVKRMEDDKVKPINGSYIFICDRDGIMQLNKDKDFRDWAKQSGQLSAVTRLPWEPLYTIQDISYVVMPQDAKRVRTDTGYDVHVGFLVGDEGYCVVGLAGMGSQPRLIFHEPGSSGSSDPFDDHGTIAYKIDSFGVTVLRGEAVIAVHYPDAAIAYDRPSTGGYQDPTTGKWVSGPMYNNSINEGGTFHKMGTLIGTKDLDMSTIWNGSAVYPVPADPHKKWAQNQTEFPKTAGLDLFTNEVPKDTTVARVYLDKTIASLKAGATLDITVLNDADLTAAGRTLDAALGTSNKGVATAAYAGGKVTITGVAEGTATLELTGTPNVVPTQIQVTVEKGDAVKK